MRIRIMKYASDCERSPEVSRKVFSEKGRRCPRAARGKDLRWEHAARGSHSNQHVTVSARSDDWNVGLALSVVAWIIPRGRVRGCCVSLVSHMIGHFLICVSLIACSQQR